MTYFLGRICLLRPRGGRFAIFFTFHHFHAPWSFQTSLVTASYLSETFLSILEQISHLQSNFRRFFGENALKIQSKSMCFKLFLLRYWPKTAQVHVFYSKIISTHRTITIRFPTHSMESGQCFQKLQRGHRWRRKFSKGITSREVTWGLPMLWSMNFEISMKFEENGHCSGFSL